MRYALPGSALVHAGILGVALIGFAWPEAEDAPAPAPVSVSIVALSTVASNSTEVVESDSTVSAVSAGSAVETVEPLTPEAIQPVEPISEPVAPQQVEEIEPETVDKAAPPTPEQAIAEAVEPVNIPELQELASTDVEAVESALTAVEPLQTAAIEPVSVEDLKVAPVPHTLSFQRPSAPTPRPEAQPRQQPQPRREAPPSQAGNGGQNQADAVASAGAAAAASGQGSGGQAEVARYPSIVIGELRRALRRTGSSRGEVVVRFTVSASGQLAGVAVASSSGNNAVDAAGIATVQRAAPFPPIPPASGRGSWTFDVPLAFGG